MAGPPGVARGVGRRRAGRHDVSLRFEFTQGIVDQCRREAPGKAGHDRIVAALAVEQRQHRRIDLAAQGEAAAFAEQGHLLGRYDVSSEMGFQAQRGHSMTLHQKIERTRFAPR